MYTTITTSGITYDGALPFSAPFTLTVRAADGATARATYVEGSMQAHPGARYVIEGALYELGRDGVLRPVANEERRAA